MQRAEQLSTIVNILRNGPTENVENQSDKKDKAILNLHRWMCLGNVDENIKSYYRAV